MEESKKVEILGHYGSVLSLIEVGLGSLLHSIHFPFAGIFLSLNQGYLLCRVALISDPTDRWMSYSVSNIAAVLKSLSPAGQKLGPMLSLSMQGLLFNVGTLIAGLNPFGLSLGMILLSLWSFVQPLITYYLFFGEKLFNAAEFLYQKTLPYHGLSAQTMTYLFFGVVILKALVGIILALMAWKSKGIVYQEKLMSIALKKKSIPTDSHPILMALLDLCRPFFLISLAMTASFLWFSQHAAAEIGWYLLRPVAIGFIFFYFSRTLTLDRWLKKLEHGRFHVFAAAVQLSLVKLRKVI